jgi:hypothetical protein
MVSGFREMDMAQPHAARMARGAALAVLLVLPGLTALGFELPVSGEGSETSNLDQLRPGDCPACATPAIPAEEAAAPIDWSLGLRGSYVSGTDGTSHRAIALSSASVSFVGARQSWRLGGEAELSLGTDGEASLDFAAGRLEGTYRLDQSTGFAGAVRL